MGPAGGTAPHGSLAELSGVLHQQLGKRGWCHKSGEEAWVRVTPYPHPRPGFRVPSGDLQSQAGARTPGEQNMRRAVGWLLELSAAVSE